MVKKSEYDPKTCPDFKSCSVPITKHYFNTMCNCKGFIKCHHFSKRRKLLKNAVDWMVSCAIQETDTLVNIEQEEKLKKFHFKQTLRGSGKK